MIRVGVRVNLWRRGKGISHTRLTRGGGGARDLGRPKGGILDILYLENMECCRKVSC